VSIRDSPNQALSLTVTDTNYFTIPSGIRNC